MQPGILWRIWPPFRSNPYRASPDSSYLQAQSPVKGHFKPGFTGLCRMYRTGKGRVRVIGFSERTLFRVKGLPTATRRLGQTLVKNRG